MTDRTCSVDGCNRAFFGRGYCSMHWQRARRRGILAGRRMPDERFWEKVEKTESCWLWTGSLDTHGYGGFRSQGRTYRAHRYSYQRLVGELPSGDLDHVCHNRRCVNPDHLRPASRKQNIENHRGARADSKSGVRGVFLHKPGRWRAQVGHNGRIINVGLFDSIEAAEAAVIAKRNELFTHNDRDRGAA